MDPVVAAVLRGALALLFAVAAVHKLRDPESFRATLAAYDILPGVLAGLGARLLQLCELAAAAALVVPRWSAVGAVLGALLLALYALAMGVNLLRGHRDLDCGCMGPGARSKIGGALIARNAVLIVAALACLLPVRPRAVVWVDVATVVLAVASLSALYAAGDRLLANAPAVTALRAELRS